MRVEIWSDNNCPWCYIGKRRFDKVLKNLDSKIQVEIQWRSFELDVSAPKEEVNTVMHYLTQDQKIPKSEVDQVVGQIKEAGAMEQIDFKFENALHVNTFDSHRLVHLAQQFGKATEMKERLLSGSWERGESIADQQKLVEIAMEILGIDEREARLCVESDQFEREVEEDEALGRMLDINSIPFYWINRKYRISGAKSAENLLSSIMDAYSYTEETNAFDNNEVNGE